jgi:hypothetical protein
LSKRDFSGWYNYAQKVETAITSASLKSKMEKELNEELKFHTVKEIEENIARGMFRASSDSWITGFKKS